MGGFSEGPIDHIDAIARREHRDVLWIRFGPHAAAVIAEVTGVEFEAEAGLFDDYDPEADPKRLQFLA